MELDASDAVHGISPEIRDRLATETASFVGYRPFMYDNVPTEDKAIVGAVLDSLSFLDVNAQDQSTRTRTNIEVNSNACIITVSYLANASLNSDALMALWDTSPMHIEFIHLVPTFNRETGQYYLVINVSVRSTSASPTVRAIVHQRQTQQLRMSRRLRHEALRRPPATVATSVVAQSEDNIRTPWATLEKRADRESAREVIEACHRMAINATNDRFWRNISVQEAIPGISDRIVIEWILPEREPLDVLAFYTFHLLLPAGIDSITCGIAHRGTRCQLCLRMVIYSAAAEEACAVNTRIVNVFSTHRARGNAIASNLNGPNMARNNDADESPLEPAQIAMRLRGKRKLEEFPDSGNKNTAVHSAPTLAIAQPQKRQRLLEQREARLRTDADESQGLLSTAIGLFESFY